MGVKISFEIVLKNSATRCFRSLNRTSFKVVRVRMIMRCLRFQVLWIIVGFILSHFSFVDVVEDFCEF